MMFFFQNLVNTFSSTVDSQVPKVNQLGQDVTNLAEDMDNLKEQVLEDMFSDKKTKKQNKTFQVSCRILFISK